MHSRQLVGVRDCRNLFINDSNKKRNICREVAVVKHHFIILVQLAVCNRNMEIIVTGIIDKEIGRRIAIGRTAVNNLRTLWKDKGVSKTNKKNTPHEITSTFFDHMRIRNMDNENERAIEEECGKNRIVRVVGMVKNAEDPNRTQSTG